MGKSPGRPSFTIFREINDFGFGRLADLECSPDIVFSDFFLFGDVRRQLTEQ
jgi:hypothetical protein